eukprot:scaffold14519_cov135-Isochrysis_galbana.AAC.7
MRATRFGEAPDEAVAFRSLQTYDPTALHPARSGGDSVRITSEVVHATAVEEMSARLRMPTWPLSMRGSLPTPGGAERVRNVIWLGPRHCQKWTAAGTTSPGRSHSADACSFGTSACSSCAANIGSDREVDSGSNASKLPRRAARSNFTTRGSAEGSADGTATPTAMDGGSEMNMLVSTRVVRPFAPPRRAAK